MLCFEGMQVVDPNLSGFRNIFQTYAASLAFIPNPLAERLHVFKGLAARVVFSQLRIDKRTHTTRAGTVSNLGSAAHPLARSITLVMSATK